MRIAAAAAKRTEHSQQDLLGDEARRGSAEGRCGEDGRAHVEDQTIGHKAESAVGQGAGDTGRQPLHDGQPRHRSHRQRLEPEQRWNIEEQRRHYDATTDAQ